MAIGHEIQSSKNISIEDLKWAVIPLRISAVLTVLLGFFLVGFIWFNTASIVGTDQFFILMQGGYIFLAIMASLVSAILPEVAIHGLTNKERWGWVLALVLGVLYCFGFFIVLGVPILATLLKKDIQTEYLK